MQTKKLIAPLPYPVYFWAVAVLAFCGFSDSIYLFISHYRVYTDIGYKSFCAISKSINCDTVSQSPYAIFMGAPISVWGIIAYSFFLSLMPFTCRPDAGKKRIWPILFLLSLAFSLYSIILALISVFYIHSYCMMCVLNYAINFVLLYYTWLIRKRFDGTGIIAGIKNDLLFLRNIRPRLVFVTSVFTAIICALLLFFPAYWNLKAPDITGDIAKGMTEDGHPWIGAAENPTLIIQEFTDYQCFQCKKMHFYLRGLIASHPDKIRMIHRHYPMDHEFNEIVTEPFHVGSGKLALVAIYAGIKGKFWEMNDLLFNLDRSQEKIELKELAEQTGLDFREMTAATINKKVRARLRLDIWTGMKNRITGTPAYLIAGKVYLAQIPPEIIQNALN